MAEFDIQGARASGYSDAEILDYLKKGDGLSNFDLKGAEKAGYSPTDILNHVAGTEKSSGPLAALQQGLSDVVGGIGSTVGSDTLKKAGADIAPKNYDSATEHVIHPKNGESRLGFVPRAVLEAAPGVATDLGAGALGAAAGEAVFPPGGGLPGFAIGAGGSYALRSYGNEAKARAVARTGNPDAEPNSTDKAIAAGSVGLQALLAAAPGGALMRMGGLGLDAIKSVGAKGAGAAAARLGTTAATAAGTGAANSAISEAARTVGTDQPFDTNAPIGGAVLGGTLGTTFGARTAAKDAVSAVRFRENGGELADASAKVANRLAEKAGDKLGNAQADYSAWKGTKDDISSEIRGLVSNDDEVAARVNNDPDARAAVQRAASKALDARADANDVRVISDAVSGTRSGDALLDLVNQSRALDKLESRGYINNGKFVGGLSGLADQTSRLFKNPIGVGATAVAGAAAGPGLIAYSPATILGLGTAYGGARIADRALGLRSPVQSFVQKFSDGGAKRIAAPAAPNEPTAQQYAAADRANATFDRMAQREQVRDAVDQMAARRANDALAQKPALDLLSQLAARTKVQRSQDAQYDAANRANDVFDRRAQREQTADAREQMAARRANAPAPAPDPLKPLLQTLALRARAARIAQRNDAQAIRAQIKDATDLMAARRSNDTFAGQGPQMRAASELMAARRANAALEEAQAEPAPAPAAPQPAAPRTYSLDETFAGNGSGTAAPAYEPKSSDYAHLPAEAAAALITQRMKERGVKFWHGETNYESATLQKLNAKATVAGDLSKVITDVEPQTLLSYVQGAKNQAEAGQLRDHLIATYPQHEKAITTAFTKQRLKAGWSK